MLYDEILEYVLKHGGGTFDSAGNNLEDCKQYAVAFPITWYKVTTLTRDHVKRAFYRLVYSDYEALGFWRTPIGEWLIEPVRLFEHRDTATALALHDKQDGIYHLDLTVPEEQRFISTKHGS